MELVRRWLRLIAGLFVFGISINLMIASGLGLGPWDAFHVGIARLTGISVGAASMAAGAVIVAGSWWIGIRPGPGTLANMVLVGVFIDVVQPVMPRAPSFAWGLAYYAAAIPLSGLATGFYIAPGLGRGPRDGLMLGLADRTGWSVRRVRTLIELSVLGAGWAMGGRLGAGTLIFALGVGPAVQWGLRVCGVTTAAPVASEP